MTSAEWSTSQAPGPEADFDEILAYADSYNAYERWADDPNLLFDMLRPVQDAWRESGRVPDWAGMDALRALLFYEYRADRFMGGYPEGERRVRDVVAAIHLKLAHKRAGEGSNDM